MRILLYLIHNLLRKMACNKKLGPIDCGSRSCYSLEGCRISLSEHEALASTLGAPTPIGILWWLTVEALNDTLCDQRGIVQSNRGKVLEGVQVHVPGAQQCP